MRPSIPEYYVTGGTLSATADCYVTRQADSDLVESLLRGELCYVLNSRQMGKSSLMVRTAMRIRESGGHAVLFDLTAIGSNVTPEQWYLGMLCQFGDITRRLPEVVAHWNQLQEVGPLQRFVSSLREITFHWPSGPIVIFIDEIDVVTQLQFSTDEFFAAIRECHNRKATDAVLGRLTFCLLGVAVPSDLIQDPTSTPFNIGRRIVLSDFTPGEAKTLERGLDQVGSAAAQKLMRRVLYWTAGHPYMTQRLCAALSQDPGDSTTRQVDRVCETLFMRPESRDSDPNLAFSQRCLLSYSLEHEPIIPIYYRILLGESITFNESDAVHNRLLLSGAVSVTGSILRVRNRVFERVFDRAWVSTQLPRSEIQVQRFVYLKGIRRGALLTAYTVALLLIAVGAVLNSRLESRRIALRDADNAYRMAYDYRFVDILLRMNHSGLPVAIQTLERTVPPPGKPDLRKFEWYYLDKICWQGVTDTGRRDGAINSIGWCADSSMLAYSCGSEVYIWSSSTGKHIGGPINTRHGKADCNSVAMSPDGRLVAMGGADGAIRIVNSLSGAAYHNDEGFRGHIGAVNSVRFSHSGRLLASGGADGIVRLWEVATGKQVGFYPHQGRMRKRGIWSVQFSPNDSVMAVGCDDGVARLFRAATGIEVSAFKGHTSYVHSLDFSPDGKLLVTGGGDHAVIVWDIASGRQVQRMFGHSSYVYDVAFSPNGKSIASCGWDKSVRIWDVATGNQIRNISTGTNAWALAFSPDNRRLAVGTSEGFLRVYDASSDSVDRELLGTSKAVYDLVISRDDRYVTAVYQSGGFDEWDLKTGARLNGFTGKDGYAASAVSADGSFIAICSKSGCVILNPKTGREVRRFNAEFDCVAAALSQDGTILCTIGPVCTVWNTVTGAVLARFKTPAVSLRVAISPDGHRIAILYDDGHAHVIGILYDVSWGHRQIPLEGGAENENTLTFGQDGVTLVGAHSTVTLWDSRTGKIKRRLPDLDLGYMAAAATRDNSRLFYATRFGQMRLWDLTTNQALMDLPDVNPAITCMSVSEDGRVLAYRLGNGSVHIMDARN